MHVKFIMNIKFPTEQAFTWLGFDTVNPGYLLDHRIQFDYLGGFSEQVRSTLHLIWLMCLGHLERKKQTKFLGIRGKFAKFM